MASLMFSPLPKTSFFSTISLTSNLDIPKHSFQIPYTFPHIHQPNQPLFHLYNNKSAGQRGISSIRFSSYPEKSNQKEGWPILRRWGVPWNWQTIGLSSLACGLSFVLTGLIEAVAIPYLGLQIEELTLDEKAELLLLDQTITTVAVLAVLYGLTKSATLPDDIYRYGIALGLSYAQTHNLLTPIIIHALWNSGIILLLTFLQLQGYDIRELIQGS